jgi:NAD(P)-dependent dehydrogenase (short-subunit alcohol dehydrogenase family)
MSANTLWDLSGKVILVTGATGALAGEAAQYLLQQGAKVIFMSRSQERIDKAISRAGENQSLASGYPCDVSDRGGLETVAARIRDQHGKLDALINGAGGNQPGATIAPGQSVFDLDLNDYDKVMDLNLKGTLLPSLVFGKMMSEQGAGSIINFSSASSLQVLTRVLGYSNAKAAVDNLTRWMAVDFAQKHGDKIRVNAVCPGFFIGQQNKALLLNDDGSLTERGQQIINKTPMGRFGEAPEICGAIHYLLSDAARFVTGQVLHVDGGFGVYTGV